MSDIDTARLREHVALLASTPMSIGLIRWNRVSNDFIAAADALDAQAARIAALREYMEAAADCAVEYPERAVGMLMRALEADHD